MRKKLMGLLLAIAMVVASIMPAMPVMAAESSFPLTFGKWLEQTKKDDNDYTFNMPSSGRVRISVEATTWIGYSNGGHIWLKTANDNWIADIPMAENNDWTLFVYEKDFDLLKGKYLIRLDRPGDFKIKVDFISAEESFPETIDTQNNSQSRASEIELNKTYKGQLAYNDSADWYKFEAPQNTKYKLDLSYVINECKLTIKDSWGKSYLNEEVIIDGPGTWTNYSNELTLPEGEYYFAIEKPSESETKNNNGNYSFSIKSDAKTVKKQLGDVTIDDLDYTGSALAPEIIVTDVNGAELTQGTDFTVKYNPATIRNAGTYKATVTGIGKYEGTKTVSFKVIAPKSISGVTASDLAYTGKTLRGKVTVKGSDGRTLKVGEDYSISYSPKSIKAIGTYKATIKGIEDYSGTKTVSFKVNPKPTTLNSVKAESKAITVSFKPQTKEMDGYYIQYSTDKNFKKDLKKVTVSKGKTSHKLTKLAGNKKYYVRIATYKKVSGKIYTSAWSTAKSTTTKR